jgi:hypothetical protein
MNDRQRALLTVAFRHVISEPNIETGFERFRALSTEQIDFDSFRNAVGECLGEGLIREPIRLPEGALQCHWHLELTPKGVAAVRKCHCEERSDEAIPTRRTR